MFPETWGDRICSLIFVATPHGLVKRMCIVFRGQGLRLTKKELDFYKSLPNVYVVFQVKAWVDTRVELEVVKHILVPHMKGVRKTYEDAGKSFPGILGVEDNFSAHMTSCEIFGYCLASELI
jgi:hypothetical protein